MLSKRAPKFAPNFLLETGVEEWTVMFSWSHTTGMPEKGLESKGLSLTFVAGLKNTIIFRDFFFGITP